MAGPIRYAAIFNDLREQILAGKFKEGDRLPSESQLVRRFKVSRPTVARALRDLQAAGLVVRRAGSGTYVRGADAGGGRGSALVGLMLPSTGSMEIFDVICGKLIGLARKYEHGVVWGGEPSEAPPGASPSDEAEAACRELIERKVQGAFFAPQGWATGRDAIDRLIAGRLRAAGIAVVLLDCDVETFPQRSDFDLVGLDNFGAAYRLTEHLLQTGCRRLRFVATSFAAPTVNARYAGFREALMRHDAPAEAGPCPATDPADAAQVRRLMAARPEALVCANDYKAAVLMRTLETLGVHVPADVRIVGFDDVKYATLLRVPLTTMHQPCHEMASLAWRILQNRLADPDLPPCAITLPAQLVIRQSCGAYLR